MLLQINTLSPLPIYEQLRNQMVQGIASGQLAPGEGLPSVRRLGADLGINFHTVNKAYTMLADEGYIVIDRRKGALVSADIKITEDFREGLSHKLALAAAEAICHGMTEGEFIALCQNHYKKPGGALQ
jgi:DNA-binding transcriptional regulator YhcF (GntR family)